MSLRLKPNRVRQSNVSRKVVPEEGGPIGKDSAASICLLSLRADGNQKFWERRARDGI